MPTTTAGQSKLSNAFIAMIVFFNSLMFALVVTLDTHTSRLHSAMVSQLAMARFGYWIVLALIPVVASNCLVLLRCRRTFVVTVLPCALTGACGLVVSVIQFGNPVYHIPQMLAFALFPVPGLVATLIRLHPVKADRIYDCNVPLSARIEWIRQVTGLWTTAAVSGLVGFFGFAYFWFQFMCSRSRATFDGVGNQALVDGLYGLELVALTAYVVVGPFRESISRGQQTSTLLLGLLPENRSSQPNSDRDPLLVEGGTLSTKPKNRTRRLGGHSK